MVNKVILIGNLGKDPEIRFTPNGKAMAKFSVATTEKWTDTQGQKQERTEWHNIVVWGKQAETCGQYLNKGRQVFVEGSIRTRSYDDRDGNKKYITEIVARDVRFLGGNNQRGGAAPQGEDQGPVNPPPGGSVGGDEFPGGDEDIPF